MASSAERRRDARLDALFGGGPEGKPDLEQIRQARIADRQEQLRWMVDQALERFESRRTDVSHDGIIDELNRRRERCHLPAIENTLLADALQKSHPLAELFCQLLNDPLGLDPSDHPALELATVELDDVGKSGGAAEQGDTETYEIEQDEGGFSLEVYLRIVRLDRERSLELLEQWEDRYPVDWWHIGTSAFERNARPSKSLRRCSVYAQTSLSRDETTGFGNGRRDGVVDICGRDHRHYRYVLLIRTRTQTPLSKPLTTDSSLPVQLKDGFNTMKPKRKVDERDFRACSAQTSPSPFIASLLSPLRTSAIRLVPRVKTFGTFTLQYSSRWT